MNPNLDQLTERLMAYKAEEIEEAGASWAAVAAIIGDTPEGPGLLFIQRAKDERDPWSGHMAFPGGRRDPEDLALVATAVRETLEEVGIDLVADGAAISQLDDLAAIGRGRRLPMIIRPFVFRLRRDVELVPNHEVSATVWVPLSFLVEPGNQASFDYDYHGDIMPFPCFFYGPYKIWGLTYAMLQGLISIAYRDRE